MIMDVRCTIAVWRGWRDRSLEKWERFNGWDYAGLNEVRGRGCAEGRRGFGGEKVREVVPKGG